jgi:hypothetical protein
MSGMLVLPWRGSDRAKQEVLDGKKASTQERAKSVETAGKYSEQALGLSSADTSCHQNF